MHKISLKFMTVEPTLYGLTQTQISLVVLVAQNSLLVLMMRYSRIGTELEQALYIASTAVFMAELLKIAACLAVLRYQQRSWAICARLIHEEIFMKSNETLKMLIPSALYALQNNLLYIALSNLEAATFQVTYQLKILSTAIFSVILLGKSLSGRQWFALILLMVGVTLVQSQSMSSPPMTETQNPWIGLCAVLTSCVSSGFAGCYFEKILKSSTTSMWVRNIQLGICGAAFSLVGVLGDWPLIQTGGLFQGYSCITWLVIINQALGGLLVSIVVKYADNILKGFATSVSIIVSSIISSYLFEFQPSIQFIIGAIAVILATYIYGVQVGVQARGLVKPN
ncbi:hypothetical protein EC973_008897 [Apophysomyces ossiformis]|uniref:UDP-galactose transporter n=1 Tax=Apophysomyces ossiformis TaxID=679940 RepID=A0A8H7ET81_9FUNG|nr:hypothetical protein EC973_008897 [Apophysomyces ossiformis]